jgi:hypothetical protein
VGTAEARSDPQADLVSDIAEMSQDPVGYCEYAYSWGERELSEGGLRPWQRRILGTIGQHLQSKKWAEPLRVAVASGHGIGKSTLVAMVIDWAMSTCEDCRITLTANTEPQLRTKTWPEVLKWTRAAINAHWFSLGATAIMVRDKARERLWRTDCIAWSENNTEAFSGLHNKGKRIVVIFDEASAISDKIWEVTEGALTDIDTEIIWLAFGNPTMNTGRFRECFGRSKHRWLTFQIDSRSVPGTNRAQIDEWISDYGEDSDFVRVRVKGEFPRAGSSQFIDSESVQKCRKYKAEDFASLPKIMAVDVARYGDDQTVIGCRQGRRFQVLLKIRGLSTVQVAERIIELIERNDYAPGKQRAYDAWIVDGDGLGAGVVDQLEHRGYKDHLFEFHGGEAAQDHSAYFNRRAEIWGLMREALRAGMEIPDDPEIEADLTGPQYGFSSKQQIQLEKKEDMKRRGLASPDMGDCLAMTFSVKIATRRERLPKMEYVYPGQRALAWMN